jgi:membrane-bound lytic murein transglycosylase B
MFYLRALCRSKTRTKQQQERTSAARTKNIIQLEAEAREAARTITMQMVVGGLRYGSIHESFTVLHYFNISRAYITSIYLRGQSTYMVLLDVSSFHY